MGYGIKYSTSNISNTLRRGNVITTGAHSANSSNNFHSGIALVDGKHTVVKVHSTKDPDFYSLDDDDLVRLINSLGGNVNTALEAKNYIQSQNDIFYIDDISSNNSVNSNLRLDLNSRYNESFINNEPTTNLASTDTARTMVRHGGSSYNHGVTFSDAPERGVGWKKAVITEIGSNYRISQFPYLAQPDGETRTYSVYYDFNGNSGYYWKVDGNSGMPMDTDDGYRTSRTYINNAGTSRTEAIFLCNNNTNTPGLNDTIYYKFYQVETQPQATSFTTGSRLQNNTWYDLSGYSNNFTPLNDIIFEKKEFEFNGTTSYMQDTVSSFNPDSAPNVMEVLFKPMDLGSRRQAIFSDNYGPEYGIWIYSDNTLRGVAYTSVQTSNIEVGRWYYAVLNIQPGANRSSTDQTYIQFYVNGQFIGENNANTGNGMNDQPFSLGFDYKSNNPNDFFSGSIALAKLSYGEYSQENVNQNYYGGNIITDDLHLAWDAGNLVSYESGSTTTYPMTGSLNGTLTNGVSFTSFNGGSFTFDGADDYISLGQSNNVGYNQTTTSWEVWIKSSDNGSSSDDWATFMGCRYGNSMQIGRYSGTSNLGILAATNNTGTGSGNNINLSNTNVTVFDEEWHHCVVTFDTGVFKVYVDGELVQTDSQRSGELLTTSNDVFGIGGSPQSSRYFGGDIAIARIYNKTLTIGEVQQNYIAHKSRFSS